jgi:hypothetical protein
LLASFVGETDWHILRQMLTASIFSLCAEGLVKLTPDLSVFENKKKEMEKK